MFTTGSKYFFGLASFALVAAFVYGAASADHAVNLETFVGVMTFGYKGSVGEHAGYAILVGLAAACLFLGGATAAFRDADAEAVSQLMRLETVPEVTAPNSPSVLPVITAFGVATVVVGLVTESAFFMLGMVILAMMVIEWTVKAWSDRATGDPAVNRAIRNRLMYPVEVPVLSLLGIAVFVLVMSRLLLVMPDRLGSYLVFGLVPVAVLAVGWYVSSRPRLNRNVLTAIFLVGGVFVLVSGIVGASLEEREAEHHGGEEIHEGEGSMAPLTTQIRLRAETGS